MKTSSNSTWKQVSELLTVASITKTLSKTSQTTPTPPQTLNQIPITQTLIHKILSNPSLHISHKLNFFNSNNNIHHSSTTYSLIFNNLCNPKTPLSLVHHYLPQLLHSMKQNGIVFDSNSFNKVLNFLIKFSHNNGNKNFRFVVDILDYIQTQNLQPIGTTPFIYNSLLIASIKNNQISLALSIFNNLMKLDDDCSEFNSVIVGSSNYLLSVLRKAQMKEEFQNVFNTLREWKSFNFDSWGYNICIHAFGSWGDLVTSMKLFNEMKEDKNLFGPDMCTYNSVLSVLCKVGKINDALIVWDELKGCGYEPDEFTYTILVRGCCKTCRMDEALRIFNEMKDNGFRPGVLVYNCVLDGLFKAAKVNEACQMFEKMAQEGVKTSCSTYNILIHGLIKNGRSEAGYTLFCDLKKKGQFVDGISYSIVVLQLCKEGHLEEALELVEEMEARGFSVDLVTITSLLIGIHKHGRWDWTDRLIKHVREGDLLPSVLKWKAGMEASINNLHSKEKDYSPMFPSKGGFSEIMSFITRSQDDDDEVETSSEQIDEWSSSPHMDKLAKRLVKSTGNASQLFTPNRGQRVQQKGPDSFDVNMVNTFLSIFLAKGKLSLACKLFEIFTDAGVDPVSYTYNSIMSSFVKKGYFNEAWAILTEMGEKLCPTDIATYNMIIQGLGKMGRADLASAVLDGLLKQGGYLDIVMYNTLINALGKAGRIDEVNKFFEQMTSSGINPDIVTYNTLIEIHSKAGRVKDAYKFLKMMLDAGCTPNHVTDTTLDYLVKEIDKLRYQKATILSEKGDPS
ncbi:pentatricopeptide repeat-containing protein At4g01570 [Trifolium pratense]|uniref:pentatricopeptide repeat-containing protein At4g01570 n=1 Tax=Trifolium pratense TaxID=57577 RepID=UPI001E6947F7|nr:pentatricopeptide repeat-containing protein At4g01570 [Trifolium pratense]